MKPRDNQGANPLIRYAAGNPLTAASHSALEILGAIERGELSVADALQQLAKKNE